MRQLFIYKCPACSVAYGLAISWESMLFAPKNCRREVENHELAVMLHKSNHKLAQIAWGVKYGG